MSYFYQSEKQWVQGLLPGLLRRHLSHRSYMHSSSQHAKQPSPSLRLSALLFYLLTKLATSKFIFSSYTECWMRFAEGSSCFETTLQKPRLWAEVVLAQLLSKSLSAQRGFLCLIPPDDPIPHTESHTGLGWKEP